jgi:hypothetical protein
MVSPGTPPPSAAPSLRQIPARLERARRLLSARHGQHVAAERDPHAAPEAAAEAEDHQGDSADQA